MCRPEMSLSRRGDNTNPNKTRHIYAWEQKNTITGQPEHQLYPSPIQPNEHTTMDDPMTTQPDQTGAQPSLMWSIGRSTAPISLSQWPRAWFAYHRGPGSATG